MTSGHLILPPPPPECWPEVDVLLARAMYPDAERVTWQLAAYHAPGGPSVFAWQAAGQIVSAAGLRVDGDHAEVRHVGTHPDHTGRGYARALLQAVAAHLSLHTLTAETDDDTVAFYRKSGFTVLTTGTRGDRQRYVCTFTLAG